MKSKVYFSDYVKGHSRRAGFRRLLKSMDAQISEFGKGSFVGIKMTVGDRGSTGFIKPEMVSILVERLKKQGAKPFVFDTNVIYSGQRQNAVDHLNLAYKKGFTPDRLGCPYIIADGVFGTDSRTVKVDSGNIKEIKVPSLVRDLDDLIVLSHITGHLMSGFAGSIKNVAMGMASRAGKQIQHSSLKPVIDIGKCTLCGTCIEICPVSAISEMSGKAFINSGLCIGCGECIAACKLDAVNINWKEDPALFAGKMADYAAGILSRIKRKLFINFAFDITLECDCICGNDHRILEDTGIFASTDILAVDKASYDYLRALTKRDDVFSRGGKIKAHNHQFVYAHKIGLGNSNYELIKTV